MNSYLQHYLLKFSGPTVEPVFEAVTCSYGKFTMYCLVGPAENIMQVTFAAEKHDHLQNQLKQLDRSVAIRKLKQKEFCYNSMFEAYFSGRTQKFPIALESPLLRAGTDFQQRIWRHISTIPYGMTISYQRLAELAGSPQGSRAAGTACGANPLALIIPCHRVVAVNGLGGYAGGVHIKKVLLAFEQSARKAA